MSHYALFQEIYPQYLQMLEDETKQEIDGIQFD